MEMEAFQLVESYKMPAKWTEKASFSYPIRLGCEIADLDLAGETLGEFLLLTNQSIFKWKWVVVVVDFKFQPIWTKNENFQLRIFSKVSWKTKHHLYPWKFNMEVENQPLEMEISIVKLQGREVAANPKREKGGMTPNLTSKDG